MKNRCGSFMGCQDKFRGGEVFNGEPFSSFHMHVMNHNWSATKQRLYLQSVAEISCHSVLSGDRIRVNIWDTCGPCGQCAHKQQHAFQARDTRTNRQTDWCHHCIKPPLLRWELNARKLCIWECMSNCNTSSSSDEGQDLFSPIGRDCQWVHRPSPERVLLAKLGTEHLALC